MRAVVALGNRLAQAPKCRATRQARAHSSAALQLGGLQGLAQWLQGRLQLPRLSPVERVELLALAKTLGRMATPLRKELREQAQLQAQAQQPQPPAPSWAERRAALIQREQQRRTGPAPSYALALARPTTTATPSSTMATPSSSGSSAAEAEAPPALKGRGRHNGSHPIGECGARIGRKIDRLLAEVRTTDLAVSAELQAPAAPEALAPQIGDPGQPQPEATNPAVAGVLADALAVTASPAPEALAPLLEPQAPAASAAADLHEAVLVAAAQGLLEPEPAEPLPVSIHALEAAWAAEPAAAAAAAELSPRARAIAELGAALLQGGQTVTLPAALAAELLESFLA